MKLISIRKISLIGSLPLLYPLIIFFMILFDNLPPNLNKQGFRILNIGIGQTILGIILYSINTLKSRRRKKTMLLKLKTFNLIPKSISTIPTVPNYKKKMMFTYLGILATTCFDNVCTWILSFTLTTSSDFLIFNKLLCFPILIFNALLTYFVLKVTFYKHHYLSAIIIILSLIIIVISEYFTYQHNITNLFTAKSLGMYCSIPFLNCGYELFCKVIMEKKYINPFKLLFFQGVFALILCAILVIVFLIAKQYNLFSDAFLTEFFFSSEDMTLLFQWPNIGLVFGYMISSSFMQLLCVLLIRYYNPSTRIISYLLSFIFAWIYSLFIEKQIPFFAVLGFIGCVCIGFGVLFHCEIIVLHCFDLHLNTKEQIIQRSKIEQCVEIENILLEEQEEEVID